MNPDDLKYCEDRREFERLLNGVRCQRARLKRVEAAKALIEQEERAARHELSRWNDELGKQVTRMSGGHA